jgi:hypothetical protein
VTGRRIGLLLVFAAFAASCGGSATGSSQPSTTSSSTISSSPSSTVPGSPGTALAALATIPVKGRAPKTGYDRDAFGPAWADVDHNGCDTRNDILRRDLEDETFRPGTHDCVVVTGVLAEPYTGQTMQFEKAYASRIQIDHVVALSDAWQKGAQSWTAERRREFANAPLELLAVSGSESQSKGDGDAATWLPPNRSFRCDYVARQVAVKQKYGLWVTSAEHDAIERVLQTCPDEPLPVATGYP